MKYIIVWAIALVFLAAIRPSIYEDKLTGCQYIQTMFTMTQRIDSDGEPVCNEDVLK